MAKRGRPKGTGKPEDEPIVQEAIRALQAGTFRSPRAAAMQFAERLPGGVDANFSRLYNKIRTRKDEPTSSTDEDEEAIEEGMIQLAVELSGESPEVKIKRLTRVFRIIAENNRVTHQVIMNLQRDGIDLEGDLIERLMTIQRYIMFNEREMAGYEEKVRTRKDRLRKALSQNVLPKKPD